MMSYLVGDFNVLKFTIALVGCLLIIRSLFDDNIPTYLITISIGWFLIAYALALRRHSESIYDLDTTKLAKLIAAYFLIIFGSLLLKIYRVQRRVKKTFKYEQTLILFLGIIFYVISKAIVIIVELNLNNFSQYMTILSISALTMGKIIHSITSGSLLFKMSLAYYVLGFAAFLLNLAYNPVEKSAAPISLTNPS